MKKNFLISFLLVAIYGHVKAQSTYVVNNTPGSAADYHILQHALDSVPAGSIILLQNSGLNYGRANINKPIVIYGAGYFLGQNAAPATQANTAESIINLISFNAGSQGSIASGLHIKDSANDQSITNSRVVFNNTNNITLSRCEIEPAVAGNTITSLNLTSSSNITVEQCFILGPVPILALSSSTSIMISNNLFFNFPSVWAEGFDFQKGVNVNSGYTLKNNTIYARFGNTFSGAQCQLFENNILLTVDTTRLSTSNTGLQNWPLSNADHNISNIKLLFQYDGSADNTNIINTRLTIDSIFLHYSNPAVSSTDGIFQLTSGSIAKNEGNDGTDAGAYGGGLPYQPSGIPAIPYAYSITVPSQGSGTISVHIKAKASN